MNKAIIKIKPKEIQIGHFKTVIFRLSIAKNYRGWKYFLKFENQHWVKNQGVNTHWTQKLSGALEAFQGMHVLPAKHSYAWLPRKYDYRTDTQTDAGQSDPYVPLMLHRRHKKINLDLSCLTLTQWSKFNINLYNYFNAEIFSKQLSCQKLLLLFEFFAHYHSICVKIGIML